NAGRMQVVGVKGKTRPAGGLGVGRRPRWAVWRGGCSGAGYAGGYYARNGASGAGGSSMGMDEPYGRGAGVCGGEIDMYHIDTRVAVRGGEFGEGLGHY